MSRKPKEDAQPEAGRRAKTSKARYLRDEYGLYRYQCAVCDGPAFYRLRQRHPQDVKCKKCRGIADPQKGAI